MLQMWSHPSWCGDFRIEAKEGDETRCTLTVIDPTPGELDRLGRFLVKARESKWVANSAIGITPEGTTVLEIAAPVAEAGCALAARNSPRGEKRGLLTAVRSVGGTIEVAVRGCDEALLVNGLDPKTEEPLPPEKQPVAAVTVRRPTLCCPTPIPGPDARASDVLCAFSTEDQWRDWVLDGRLVCRGNLTGHRYEILHRHHPLARKRGKITFDLEDQHIVHCYDWSVPPAEEVLEVKLILEHRENWIRNRSGYFGPNPRFINPFVPMNRQFTDGVLDTSLIGTLGFYGQMARSLRRNPTHRKTEPGES